MTNIARRKLRSWPLKYALSAKTSVTCLMTRQTFLHKYKHFYLKILLFGGLQRIPRHAAFGECGPDLHPANFRLIAPRDFADWSKEKWYIRSKHYHHNIFVAGVSRDQSET